MPSKEMLERLMAAGVFVSLLIAVAARNEDYRRFLESQSVSVSSNSNQGCDCNKASTTCVCVHGTCNSLGHDTHSCHCEGNWAGEMCDIAIDPSKHYSNCGPDPCLHGRCYVHTSNGISTHACNCHAGWTGKACDTVFSNHAVSTQVLQSSAASTHPTINAVTTTWLQTTSHLHTNLSTSVTFYTCNKIAALTAVAKGESIASSRVPAGSCPNSGAHSGNELVYQLCQVPEHWHQGSNVLELCKQDAMPEYSPLAVFENGAISEAGIFVSCLQDGFQMIQQTCDQPPRILRMTVDNSRTPSFYTLL